MFITRLRKIGDSVGLVIDRTTLESAGISESDTVVVTPCGRGRLMLRTLTPRGMEFVQAALDESEKWRDVLRDLGED